MEKDIEAKESKRRNNFFRAVSRTSSDRHFYHRDLLMLMKLSIRGNEIDLALNLGKCISQRINQMSVIFLP